MKKLVSLVLLFAFSACTNHPTVLPGKLQPGETSYTYSFSYENIVPVYTMYYGLNSHMDVSAAIGLPIWGSGAAVHFLVASDTLETKILNSKLTAGWTWHHNPEYEISYLRERCRPARQRVFMYGFRSNYIDKGISGDSAWRFGLVTGILLRYHYMFELGYTHDFQLETVKIDPVNKWPTEHHYMTGISVKFSIGDFRAGLEK